MIFTTANNNSTIQHFDTYESREESGRAKRRGPRGKIFNNDYDPFARSELVFLSAS